MELIQLSHYVYQCDYHIVLVTKYRKGIFDEGIFAYINKRLAEITEHYPLIRFKVVNHDKDHVHLLMSIPPTTAVGKVIGIVKQNTSREMKQKFPFLKKVYWGTDAVWSEGYFVSTVGIDEAIIRRLCTSCGYTLYPPLSTLQFVTLKILLWVVVSQSYLGIHSYN